MFILISFFIISLNLISLHFAGITIIFFLMRIQSVLSFGFSMKKPILTLAYLLFIPEMITGPHREFVDWNAPKFKTNIFFRLETILELLVYLNLIFGSGIFYNYLIDINNFYFYETFIVGYTTFIQFWSASRIVNLISSIFDQKKIYNFRNPFIAKSLSDFWPRWHVSLSNFTKKYITQPFSYLALKKGINQYISYIIAISISFIFIAIWHKLSFSYFFFALICVFILSLERIFFLKILKKISNLYLGEYFCITYTQICFLICISPIKEDLQNILIHPS